MCPSPPDKNSKSQDQLFKRPGGVLIDEKQWLFIKRRYHMTPRELQVAILVCRGFNNNDISNALKIKHGTVKTHLRNIYRRARVKSKILLLLRFIEDVNKYYTLSESQKPEIPIKEFQSKAKQTIETPED